MFKEEVRKHINDIFEAYWDVKDKEKKGLIDELGNHRVVSALIGSNTTSDIPKLLLVTNDDLIRIVDRENGKIYYGRSKRQHFKDDLSNLISAYLGIIYS